MNFFNRLSEYLFGKTHSARVEELHIDKNKFKLQFSSSNGLSEHLYGKPERIPIQDDNNEYCALLESLYNSANIYQDFSGQYSTDTLLYSNNISIEYLINTLQKGFFPRYFFIYCYKFEYSDDSLEKFKALYKYHTLTIMGYSPISAAIIAPNICLNIKRDFISKLLISGFQPTVKDLLLCNLEIYDSISDELKYTMILMLCDINLLNQDLRRHIVNMIMEKLKILYSPLV